MKKLAILFAMMFAVALWFGSTVSATDLEATVSSESEGIKEFCDDTVCDPSGDNDIKSVSATSDGENILVTVIMCADVDVSVPEKRMVKYRLHIDHKSPEGARYEDGDEFTADSVVDLDDCETSDDDGVMFRVHKNKAGNSAGNLSNGKVYGPGTVVFTDGDNNMLEFTVPYAGLLDDETEPGAVAAGDVVHLWVDVQQKQICDRAPNTDDSDFCAKPENEDEVLSILLQ